ncbi:hypothetical protein XBP1_1050024 [Xenorhabdus bovienii str. puntauvense]|uniref:Uncharacterized protein n=1 Tax=Xenorhabdus bovienii str. puntauvense TaxID=1398201 RepID=A0A077NA46_XENBV|nr:hypothetical protein XBP1_1050024 [Xenorhabdus bovienii str. puntauvense]
MSGIQPEVIIRVRFTIIHQIGCYHLFRSLAYRRTKIASSPKMLTLVTLFQENKLFKQLAHCPSFYSPHNF